MAALFVSAIIGFPCGSMVRERHPLLDLIEMETDLRIDKKY